MSYSRRALRERTVSLDVELKENKNQLTNLRAERNVSEMLKVLIRRTDTVQDERRVDHTAAARQWSNALLVYCTVEAE